MGKRRVGLPATLPRRPHDQKRHPRARRRVMKGSGGGGLIVGLGMLIAIAIAVAAAGVWLVFRQ